MSVLGYALLTLVLAGVSAAALVGVWAICWAVMMWREATRGRRD